MSDDQGDSEFGKSDSNTEWIQPVELGFIWRDATEYPTLIHDVENSFLLVCLADFDPSGNRTGVTEWRDCLCPFVAPDSPESRWDDPRFADPRSTDVLWLGEVVNSEWANRYSTERVPMHHYVMPFNDWTFECLASGFVARTDPRPLVDVLPDITLEVQRRWAQKRSEWEQSEWYRNERDRDQGLPRIGWPWQ